MNIGLNFISSVTKNYSSSLFNDVGNWMRRVSPIRVGIAIGVSAILAVLAVKLFYYIQDALSTSGSPSQDLDHVNFKQEDEGFLPQFANSPFKLAKHDNQPEQVSPSPANSDSQCAATSPSPLVEDDLTQPIVAKTLISESISPKALKYLKTELTFLNNAQEIEELKIVLPPASFSERIIKEDIFKIIAQTCPNLESLSLCASQEEAFPVYLSGGLESLSELSKLKSLQMVNLSAENLSVGLNKSLETLHIESCIFSHFPKEVKDLENLHTLSLTQNLFDKNLDNDGLAQEYSDILTSLKGSLVNVNLQDFRLRTLPAAFVGDAFKEFAKLKKLDLQGSPLIEKPDFSSKQVHQSILLDNDYSASTKALTGQNVMIIGRSRSGKSTLMDVLANHLLSKKSSIFSESKGSSFKTITIPDLLIDGKPAQINVHDTPGLFEVRKVGEESRTNKDILSLIYQDSNNFFGQKSLENIDHVILTFSPEAGINQGDLNSMLIGLPFLYRMGLPSTTKILMVMTRTENYSVSYLNSILNQLDQHSVTSKIISEYGVEILFSGAKDIYAYPTSQAHQENRVILYRERLLSKLFDTEVEDVETVVSNQIDGDVFS